MGIDAVGDGTLDKSRLRTESVVEADGEEATLVKHLDMLHVDFTSSEHNVSAAMEKKSYKTVRYCEIYGKYAKGYGPTGRLFAFSASSDG